MDSNDKDRKNYLKLRNKYDSYGKNQQVINRLLKIVEALKEEGAIGDEYFHNYKRDLKKYELALSNTIKIYENIMTKKDIMSSANQGLPLTADERQKVEDLLVRVEELWNQGAALDNKWFELRPKILRLDTKNPYIKALQRKGRENFGLILIKLAVSDILINILSSIDALTLSQFPGITRLVTEISDYKHQEENKANQKQAKCFEESNAIKAQEMKENTTTSIKRGYLSEKEGEENTNVKVRSDSA